MKQAFIVAILVATASFTLVGCKGPSGKYGGSKAALVTSCQKCGDGPCKCAPKVATCKGCGGTKATCKCPTK